MKHIATIILATLLAACTVTPQDLRGESGRTYSASIEGSPEQVYRRVASQLRDCISKSNLRMESDYYGGGSGRIVLRVQEEMVNMTMVDATFTPAGSGVDMAGHYYISHFGDGEANRWLLESMAAWGAGKPGQCQF